MRLLVKYVTMKGYDQKPGGFGERDKRVIFEEKVLKGFLTF